MLKIDEFLTLALNGSHSLYIDGLAWTITQTVTWLPVGLLLLYVLIRNNDLRGVCLAVAGIALCILLADQVASSLFKPLVARWRPSNDPYIMYTVDIVNGYRGGRYGFFSSHAANTMAVATYVSLLVRFRPLTLWLYSWALLNCWSRVYLGVHYMGDLAAGTLWGILVGWAVCKLSLRYFPTFASRRKSFATRPNFSQGGYSIGSLHLLIAGLGVSYLYIAFHAMFFH